MTLQEKHAKLADIDKQIRKISNTVLSMKVCSRYNKRNSLNRAIKNSYRILRLGISWSKLNNDYNLILSQPTQ